MTSDTIGYKTIMEWNTSNSPDATTPVETNIPKRYHTILLRSSPGDRFKASILSLMDSILLLYVEYRSWKSFLNCAATSFIKRCCLIHSYSSRLHSAPTVKLLLFAGRCVGISGKYVAANDSMFGWPAFTICGFTGGALLGIASGGGNIVFVFTGDGFCAGNADGGMAWWKDIGGLLSLR